MLRMLSERNMMPSGDIFKPDMIKKQIISTML
jgi:hypothetical protein